ncbi:tetratricopeptide repeat protein [Pseudofrankia sp. BMG5.37]|uniref:tetratricopeptide repeat protein n=1 Tax=Pseudofrankia sp. BMG5.37 TaxID=3050035 RepID=UPI002895FD38|nr:tetratricopeptide repeat protein [Pseudofrankia sp. BMG5.37]MDT3442157.1 tetratricopeptide repeat protein [Pseudofrankia sp. BMG5.37]
MTGKTSPRSTTPDVASVTESGNASADNGAVANTGVMGDVTVHHHPQAVPAPVWPVVVGQPPALASAFQPRQGLRDQIVTARHGGADVVLAQGESGEGSAVLGTRVLAGGGGIGKSQLAAWFAHQAAGHGTDLVVWVNAASGDQVVTTYARAAARVGAPGATGADATADAAALLEWLHTTDRTWLVVLDDITDPAHLAGLWPPHCPGGWTLATTRLRDATLASSGRQRVDVDVYTPDESVAYLTGRLTDAGRPHLLDATAADLATALGQLPLALSHATAYMLNQEEGCATYLARYTTSDERLAELMPPGADPDAYGRPVAVALLLTLEAANTAEPAGLARPALALAAVYDPAGHPDTLWTTTAITDYLAAHRTDGAGQPITAGQARKALRLLDRYGLLTHTPTDGARAVRIHALTARAAREAQPDGQEALAKAAADALLAVWPTLDGDTVLAQVLRANTDALHATAPDALWQAEGHSVLFRAATSLGNVGLVTAATDQYRRLADIAAHRSGSDHSSSLIARGNLARWQGMTGDAAGAATSFEALLADFLRVLGPSHPGTLTTRGYLANWQGEAGNAAGAATALKALLPDLLFVLGPYHSGTLATRSDLARWRGMAGDAVGAAKAFKKLLTDRLRLLDPKHPDILVNRGHLAYWRGEAGDAVGAVEAFEELLPDCVEVLGPDHPDTLTTRSYLTRWRGEAGNAAGAAEAFEAFEKLLTDRLRILGPDHPETLTARSNLARWRGEAGNAAGAAEAFDELLTDRLRLLGPDHPHTLITQSDLAYWQSEAGLSGNESS